MNRQTDVSTERRQETDEHIDRCEIANRKTFRLVKDRNRDSFKILVSTQTDWEIWIPIKRERRRYSIPKKGKETDETCKVNNKAKKETINVWTI